jgi:tRNA(Ile)-lysidine synthase TilS/MesJ
MKTSKIIECKKCINTNQNPFMTFDKNGYCNVCAIYRKNFDVKVLKKELKLLKSFTSYNLGKPNAMVGISGGKDSTATLHTIKEMGFRPLAFTLDIGYYPKHILSRAESVAKAIGAPHEIIDIKKYIRKVDIRCYQESAQLYDERESEELKDKFGQLYKTGREHYSIKCAHVIPFVRTCQLCRRTVIRAYYAEAIRHGIKLVVLGINEWANLSSSQNMGKKVVISAFRRLKPYKNKPAIYVVHLPFLLQRTIKDTKDILKKIKWEKPAGEKLIESNANSCLFALAAEEKATKMLGFHPDTTRLAREVTAGFISKKEAKIALSKKHKYPHTVSEVLKRANII